jgi:YVTN family beta-propeller protein
MGMFPPRKYVLTARRSSEGRKSNLFRNLFALVVVSAGAGMFLGVPPAEAQNAYITNSRANTVSVIDTATNRVGTTIAVGSDPKGVAVSPDGSKVYVKRQKQHRLGDRHGYQYSDRRADSRQRAPRGIRDFHRAGVDFGWLTGAAKLIPQECLGVAKTHGGLDAAVQALGFPSAQWFKYAIESFCVCNPLTAFPALPAFTWGYLSP